MIEAKRTIIEPSTFALSPTHHMPTDVLPTPAKPDDAPLFVNFLGVLSSNRRLNTQLRAAKTGRSRKSSYIFY